MDTDTPAIYLERIDGRRNMARFYQLSVEVDLFGDIVSVRRWGRIGSHGCLVNSLQPSLADAFREVQQRADEKRRRGYCDVDSRRNRDRAAENQSPHVGRCCPGIIGSAANDVVGSNGGNTLV